MHRRAKGWSLWISAAIVLSGAAAAAVSIVGHRRAHSPRTDAHLHLPIGDLRSQAEEGRLLVRIARADELTPTFTAASCCALFGRRHARVPWTELRLQADRIYLRQPARTYGLGSMERRLGRWIAKVPGA